MKITYLTKNYKLKQYIKDAIEEKVARLDKFFDADTEIKVFLKEEPKDVFVTELTLYLDRVVVRSEVSAADTLSNVDAALKKIERQIVKSKTKLEHKFKKSINKAEAFEADAADGEYETGDIIKNKSFKLLPLSVNDAREELELVGHSFFVFLNSATGNVNVVYKRKGGGYGLIEATV